LPRNKAARVSDDEVANRGGRFCRLLLAFIAIEYARQPGPFGRHFPQDDAVFPATYRSRDSETAFGYFSLLPTSFGLISGLSYSTTFNRELRISSLPLYSM
jgi:hypothetical protein